MVKTWVKEINIFSNKKNKESKEKEILIDTLSNELRRKILEVLYEQDKIGLEGKEISIVDLTKIINSRIKKKHDPNAIAYHLNNLERQGFIKLDKKEDKKGRPVMVKLKNNDPLYLVHGKKNYRIF